VPHCAIWNGKADDKALASIAVHFTREGSEYEMPTITSASETNEIPVWAGRSAGKPEFARKK
jgi:hypothetical protein